LELPTLEESAALLPSPLLDENEVSRVTEGVGVEIPEGVRSEDDLITTPHKRGVVSTYVTTVRETQH
jgi:hypothetical protein